MPHGAMADPAMTDSAMADSAMTDPAMTDPAMTDLEIVDDHTIAGGHAAAVSVMTGDLVELTDLEGQQVGDLIGFARDDRHEWLSASHTRAATLCLNLRIGDVLQSNWRRPMLELVQDDVGTHDIITQMCDERRYRLDYGVEGHRSCRSNFVEVLAPWSYAEWEMPDPFNLFQNAPIFPDRTFGNQAPTSVAGDHLSFKVLMDSVLAVSACPQDLNACNGYRPSPLRLRVFRTSRGGIA